jgi:hypothetical protein
LQVKNSKFSTSFFSIKNSKLYFRDLEKVIKEADDILGDAFSLTKDNIEDLIDELLKGDYSKEELEEELVTAYDAALKLINNMKDTKVNK